MQDAYSHCEALVREADKDRFLASLFVPADRRGHIFALYAFNVEVARIRETARQALPGEMRLQWWRDVLSGRGYGNVKANPVAAALLDTVTRCSLPTEPLLDLLQARSFDFYDDPMPTLGDLEVYLRATSCALFDLTATMLRDGRDAAIADAAGHAGMAYGLTGLLRALPIHTARRQLYLPLDLLDRHGVDSEAVFTGQATPGFHAALRELRDLAREHLDALTVLMRDVPPSAAPAFIPLALVRPALRRMERRGYDPFAPVELSQWRRQLAMWRATWGGILGF